MLSLATSLYCTGTTLSQLAPDLTGDFFSFCAADTFQCDDQTLVLRNPNDDCQFHACKTDQSSQLPATHVESISVRQQPRKNVNPDPVSATTPAPVLSVEEIRTTIRRADSSASDEDLPLILRNDTDGPLVKTEEEEIDAPVLKTEEKEIEEIAEEEVTGTTSPSSSSPFTFQTSFGMLGTSLVMVLMQQHL